METYTLLINPATDSKLAQLALVIADKKKTKLVLLTEKNTNDLHFLGTHNFDIKFPSLIVSGKVHERAFQILGEKNIIEFLRNEQFKIRN